MPAKRKKSRKKMPRDYSVEEKPNQSPNQSVSRKQKKIPKPLESSEGTKNSKTDWLSNISKRILEVEDQIAESKKLKEQSMRKRSMELAMIYRRSSSVNPAPIKEETEQTKSQAKKKQFVIVFCGSWSGFRSGSQLLKKALESDPETSKFKVDTYSLKGKSKRQEVYLVDEGFSIDLTADPKTYESYLVWKKTDSEKISKKNLDDILQMVKSKAH